jgi:hypothetical protein
MLMFIPFHINFGFRWKFSFKNSIHKPLMCLRTHQFISIIITIKCLYLLGDIAHQMQHIDFVQNPPTIYFGEPYNSPIFYFGSTYIPLWTTQGPNITHPNLIEMTQI